MNKRELKYNSVKEVIDDVQRLKRGHKQNGNWTLPQATWHCGLAIANCLKPIADGTQSTPEQLEMQKSRLLPLISGGQIPSGLPTPPGTDPVKEAPQSLDDKEVDNFIHGLKALDSTQLKQIAFGRFGVVSMDQFREFVQIHTAHHMSHFTPAS
jgi:hypothetical protein